MDTPTAFPISIVVRNRNQATDLKWLIRALQRQTLRAELILVDNESTDESIEVARGFGAKIVPITRQNFSYGRAINIGIEVATAETVVLLSSHSLPIGATFLEECLRPFADPDVVAARCLRADWSEEWLDGGILEGPIDWNFPLQRLPENNGAILRKSIWQRFPFNEELEAAEDKLWSYQILNAGYKIAESSALYKYRGKDRFLASLRRFLRVQTELFRMRGPGQQPVPAGELLRRVFYEIPVTAALSALNLICRHFLFYAVPWAARRKRSAGSVR